MQRSGGRAFWAAGTASAKALGCLCVPRRAQSQGDWSGGVRGGMAEDELREEGGVGNMGKF